MRSESLYRILVATIFVLLMVVGIYIGIELTEKADKLDEADQVDLVVSNTSAIKVDEEQGVTLVQEEEIVDVDIKFVDVYPECGHNIESKEHQENTTKDELKREIENKDLGYRLIGEEEGILIYQKVNFKKFYSY